jgi:hypothetical protein
MLRLLKRACRVAAQRRRINVAFDDEIGIGQKGFQFGQKVFKVGQLGETNPSPANRRKLDHRRRNKPTRGKRRLLKRGGSGSITSFPTERRCKQNNNKFAASAAVQNETGNFIERTALEARPLGRAESVSFKAFPCLFWGVSSHAPSFETSCGCQETRM